MKSGILTVMFSAGLLSCTQTAYKDSIQRELNYVNAIPFVKNISPSANNTDVDVNATIVVEFGSAMNVTATTNAFSMAGPTGTIAGAIVWQTGNTTFVFTPSSTLAYKTSYTITIASSAKTQFGTAMPTAHTTTFTTNGNVYVATTGNNATGDGTKPKPYLTIQYAIDQAKAKAASDVLVGAGDYNEQITMRRNVSLRGGYHPMTWARDWNIYVSRVIRTSYNVITFPSSESIDQNTVLEGLTIRVDASLGTNNYLIYVDYSSPKILRNRIQNFSSTSLVAFYNVIYVNGLSTPQIEGNLIEGAGYIIYGIIGTNGMVANVKENQITLSGEQAIGIVAQNSASLTATGNVIKVVPNDVSAAIYFKNGFGSIRNNIIDGGYWYGIGFVGTLGVTIISNNLFISDSSQITLELAANSTKPVIYNNLFIARTAGSFANIEQNTNSGQNDLQTIANNTFFGPTSWLYRRAMDNFTVINPNLLPNGSGNIVADPKLSSATDFHFTAASPPSVTAGGLDTSTGPYGFVTTDYDGNPRTCPVPVSNCYSMGPYEKDN